MTDTKRLLVKSILRSIRPLLFLAPSPKTHIVFEACEKFHYFHMEPIVHMLLHDPNFKITIVKWNNFSDNDRIQGINYISFNEFWHDWFSLFDILVTTELERRPGWFKDGTAICMFHGAGPKMSYMNCPAIFDYDIIFSVGPLTYESQKNYVKDKIRIEKVGLPILDSLIDKTRPPTPHPIVLDTSKPTLLYAPSWSLDNEHISMNEEILESLSKQDDFNIIIRPHPNLLDPNKCNGFSWKEKFLALSDKGVQISYSHDHSAYQLLPHIDVLIGDISAVTYEYAILDRPIILYMKDGILDDFDATEFLEPLLAASTRLTNPEELKQVLSTALSNNDPKSDARKQLIEKTFFNIGKATESATSVIKSLTKNNPYH